MKNALKFIIIIIFLHGCNKDDSNPNSGSLDFNDILVVELNDTSEPDYFVTLNSSSEFFVVESQGPQSPIPKKISYFNQEINDFVNIFLDNLGAIDKVVVQDNIMIFHNTDQFTFDMGVYTSDSQELLLSEIESEYNWDLSSESRSTNNNYLDALLGSTAEILKGIGCVFKAVATAYAGDVSLSTFIESFECGLGIGEAIAEILVDNGFQIYVDQDVIDNFDRFFEYYDAFSLWFSCLDITDLSGLRECFLAVLSNILSNIEDDEFLLENNEEELGDILDNLSILFHSEYIDFLNNEIPPLWEFTTNNNAEIANEQMNAYTLDGVARLSKEGIIGKNIQQVKLEMDVFIAYSFWGLVYNFIISSEQEEMGFRTGQEDFEYPANTIANLVQYYNDEGANLVDESLSAVEEGVYHVELIIDQSSYVFRGENEIGVEVFSLTVPLENYIDVSSIDKIEFSNIANTNNNGWIDNIRLSFN